MQQQQQTTQNPMFIKSFVCLTKFSSSHFPLGIIIYIYYTIHIFIQNIHYKSVGITSFWSFKLVVAEMWWNWLWLPFCLIVELLYDTIYTNMHLHNNIVVYYFYSTYHNNVWREYTSFAQLKMKTIIFCFLLSYLLQIVCLWATFFCCHRVIR